MLFCTAFKLKVKLSEPSAAGSPIIAHSHPYATEVSHASNRNLQVNLFHQFIVVDNTQTICNVEYSLRRDVGMLLIQHFMVYS